MNSDLQIFLISPGAHYPSHNWTNTVDLMRALRKRENNVRAIIFSSPAGPIPPELAGTVESVFSRPPARLEKIAAGKWQERRFGGFISGFETAACLLKAVAKAKQPNDTILHFIGGSYWIVILACLLFRRRHFVFSIYGGILEGRSSGIKALIRPFLRWLIQRAAATNRLDFICETELLHEQLFPLLGLHIKVIPYAIDDSEELRPQAEARRRLDLPQGEKVVLFFGTHRREKDYHTSLKGCLALPHPPLALFVGKVISSNDPRTAIADCHYPRAVVVDEFVSEEKAKDYFAAADVVALPYEANFSRGSGVLIECCRHMRPVIASATPYFLAFLARYKCGVSFAPGNSGSFAESAARLLAGIEQFQNPFAEARSAHSWTVAVDQFISLYQENLRMS